VFLLFRLSRCLVLCFRPPLFPHLLCVFFSFCFPFFFFLFSSYLFFFFSPFCCFFSFYSFLVVPARCDPNPPFYLVTDNRIRLLNFTTELLPVHPSLIFFQRHIPVLFFIFTPSPYRNYPLPHSQFILFCELVRVSVHVSPVCELLYSPPFLVVLHVSFVSCDPFFLILEVCLIFLCFRFSFLLIFFCTLLF